MTKQVLILSAMDRCNERVRRISVDLVAALENDRNGTMERFNLIVTAMRGVQAAITVCNQDAPLRPEFSAAFN